MQYETSLGLNHHEAAAQVLDNEVIIIRLVDGIYYSMQGVGVLVWNLVEKGGCIEDIVKTVVEHYEVDVKRARKDVTNLIDTLLKERIVVYDDASKKTQS